MSEPSMMREPAWVTALADQRVAEIAARTTPALLATYAVVLSPLVDMPDGADVDRWERTCDNCGTFVPEGPTFNAGMVQREAHGKQVILSYGACDPCLGRVDLT
jgi:hypothetical protein